MELLDFNELPAALLAVHPLLQPLVSLQRGEKMERSVDTVLISHGCAPLIGERITLGLVFKREESPRRAGQIKLTFIAALEHSGTPSLYFPVINPQASGDQVIAPTPETAEQGDTSQ